jgi:hypothetical protein
MLRVRWLPETVARNSDQRRGRGQSAEKNQRVLDRALRAPRDALAAPGPLSLYRSLGEAGLVHALFELCDVLRPAKRKQVLQLWHAEIWIQL